MKESKISVYLGDITALSCDCIVNAANKSLLGGGGVDGAIHRAAGPELLAECKTLHGCNTGEAKITKGYRLKAKWVIHTVGPVYSGKPKDALLLESCYRSTLDLALQYSVRKIAFPAISTGVYRYPLQEAVPIAVRTVTAWLGRNREYPMDLIFCCFDRTTYDSYQKFLAENNE